MSLHQRRRFSNWKHSIYVIIVLLKPLDTHLSASIRVGQCLQKMDSEDCKLWRWTTKMS